MRNLPRSFFVRRDQCQLDSWGETMPRCGLHGRLKIKMVFYGESGGKRMSEKTLFQFWWYSTGCTGTCSTCTCTGTGTGSTCTVGTTATGTEVQVTYDRYSCRTYKHIIHADCRYLHSDVHYLFFLPFFFTFLITLWS